MTVSTQYQPFTFKPGAAMAAEAIPWQFLAGEQLVVTHIDAVTAVETVLVPGDDFSVGGSGPDGTGSVTALAAWPVNDDWRVERATSLEQEYALPPFEALRSSALERENDRQLMALQEQEVAMLALDNRALQVPKGELAGVIPSLAGSLGKFLARTLDGNWFWSAGTGGGDAALRTDLANPAAGASIIAFLRASVGSVATILQTWLSWREISAFEFMTNAQVADYQTGALTLDLTIPLQNWLNAAAARGLVARLPKGLGKITSPLVPASGVTIRGTGVVSAIAPHGCDGFVLPAGTAHVVIENIGMFSYNALGIPDTRNFDAIYCVGTNPAHVDFVTLRDLYLQGWGEAIRWNYTWGSLIDNVTIINCDYGIVLFGQSVNNKIDNSYVSANGGIACINLVPDPVNNFFGEGLMITNTLLASGQYGVRCALGFLSLHVSNCVIDLIQDTAFELTDCKKLMLSSNWIYATNRCVNFNPLGAFNEQSCSLTGNTMIITSANGTVVRFMGNNGGLTIVGGTMEYGGVSTGCYLQGIRTLVEGVNFNSTSSNFAIFLDGAATNHKIGKNTGVATYFGGFGTPEYQEGTWVPTDASTDGIVITNITPATYVKVGKMVTCQMDISFPVNSGAQLARITLPFQPQAGAAAPVGSLGFQDINGTFKPIASNAAPNFVFVKPGASFSYATNAEMGGAGGSRLTVTFSYRANV